MKKKKIIEATSPVHDECGYTLKTVQIKNTFIVDDDEAEDRNFNFLIVEDDE